MAAAVFATAGMRVVNMPGGEVLPAAEHGVIDCAEWVTAAEDIKEERATSIGQVVRGFAVGIVQVIARSRSSSRSRRSRSGCRRCCRAESATRSR
jgi:hypothetical protein